VLGEAQALRRDREQALEHRLALEQRSARQVLAVEMQEIEDEIHELVRRVMIGRRLHGGKGRQAVRADRTEFAVEIGLPDLAAAERRRGRPVAVGPVQPGAREQAHVAAVNPRVDAVAVELDLMDPPVAGGRLVPQKGELRLDEGRQRACGRAPGRHCRRVAWRWKPAKGVGEEGRAGAIITEIIQSQPG